MIRRQLIFGIGRRTGQWTNLDRTHTCKSPRMHDIRRGMRILRRHSPNQAEWIPCCHRMAVARNCPARIQPDRPTLQSAGDFRLRVHSRHDARHAGKYLHRKCEIAAQKGLAAPADSFIGLAAGKSSASGKSCMVRCDTSALLKARSGSWASLLDCARAPTKPRLARPRRYPFAAPTKARKIVALRPRPVLDLPDSFPGDSNQPHENPERIWHVAE